MWCSFTGTACQLHSQSLCSRSGHHTICCGIAASKKCNPLVKESPPTPTWWSVCKYQGPLRPAVHCLMTLRASWWCGLTMSDLLLVMCLSVGSFLSRNRMAGKHIAEASPGVCGPWEHSCPVCPVTAAFAVVLEGSWKSPALLASLLCCATPGAVNHLHRFLLTLG
jgi:hypothetical protein